MLTKVALEEITPVAFIFYRNLIGTLCMLPSLAFMSSGPTRKELFRGTILAMLLGAMMFLQTMGLKTVPASVGAFLIGFSIVFVLAIRCITERKLPGVVDVVASLICVAGLWLVTDSHSVVLQAGVLYMLLCALFISLYIHTMSDYARNSRVSVLTLVQMVVLAVVAGGSALVAEGGIAIPEQAATWGSVLFCGAICSALCFWIQGYAQQHMSSFRASAINILEPVFASILAYWFMGEALSYTFCLGATMILGAVTLINWRLESPTEG